MSRERWTRRAADAATEAVLAGATDDEIRAAVEAGIREGHRVAAIRRGEVPTQRGEHAAPHAVGVTA